MNNPYTESRIDKFVAWIYDPVLFLVMKPIRLSVMSKIFKYKDKAVLDLCCGTGNQLKLLAENKFINLHGLDISSSMLEIAKTNNPSIKIYNEDATKTSLKDESFEVIIISFAIHEKNRAIQEDLIKEAYRLIKKDGILLVVDYFFHDKTSKLKKTGIKIIERIAGMEHYNNFKNYIQNNGLSSLIKKDKFELKNPDRKPTGGVGILIYQKV